MAEHTPTPWRVFTNPDGTKLVGIGKPDGEGILDCGFGVWSWNDLEGIANAKMVVKAVNSHDALVKALELLTDELPEEMHTLDEPDEDWEVIVKMRAIAREALASIKEHK